MLDHRAAWLIDTGQMTTEIRVNDSSRKKIKEACLIRVPLAGRPDFDRVVCYDFFDEMFDHEPVASVNPLVTREEQLATICQIYPPEEEALDVVIGIELGRLAPNNLRASQRVAGRPASTAEPWSPLIRKAITRGAEVRILCEPTRSRGAAGRRRSAAAGNWPGLEVQGSLDGTGKADQGELIELADGLADPRPVQPG
jgi:ASC-1-like (ASCH) protein